MFVAQASEASPRPGDLLVTDEHNGRVLRVVPRSGHVETLSPWPGQENFLQRPTGIAVSRTDRSIYVLDDADGRLIRIDPATGEQSVQHTLRLIDPIFGLVVPWPLSFPGTIRGLEIPPREPGAVGDRLLVIGSTGVHETSFDGSTWSPPVLRTTGGFPSPAGAALDRYGDPLRLWVATGGTTLQEATASGAGFALEQAALFPGQQIVDVDVSPSGRSAMLVRSLSAPKVCISAAVFSLSFQGLSSGQELRCPTALALGPRGELYIADVLTLDGGLAKIAKVVDGAATVVAELPPGDSVFTMPADIEVMPGEATFEWVEQGPEQHSLRDASADGEVVVGEEGSQAEASVWRWTRTGGIETIASGGASGISADGSTVLLRSSSEMLTWSAPSGLAPVTSLPEWGDWEASAISGDGRVLVGHAEVQGDVRAVRWHSGVPSVLPSLDGADRCWAEAASRDGSVAVGTCDLGSALRAVLWDAGGAVLGLHGSELPPSDSSVAVAVSGDGRTVFGNLLSGGFLSISVFRWTAEQGPQILPVPDPDSRADSISGSGRRVLLFSSRPYLWDADLGTRDLWTELVEVYGLDVESALLDETQLLTRDGRTLLGSLFEPDVDIWRIRLVPEPGGGALALATLGALGWLGLRRRT